MVSQTENPERHELKDAGFRADNRLVRKFFQKTFSLSRVPPERRVEAFHGKPFWSPGHSNFWKR